VSDAWVCGAAAAAAAAAATAVTAARLLTEPAVHVFMYTRSAVVEAGNSFLSGCVTMP
jgi:hypothetical protein